MSSDLPASYRVSRIGLRCLHVGKTYPSRSGLITALDDVTFHVDEGEFVCVVGPSGCGKTTILKILAGLIEPTDGRLAFGADSGANRPQNALVFQEHGLYPWMSILDNVAFGLETLGVGKHARQRQANDFLEQVGLGAFAANYPHELSVGMRQRAAIARAFITDPQLLLMDEPFSALDAQSKLVLQEELLRIWKDDHKMVVYVTHDIQEAVLLGDRVLVMTGRPGRIQEELKIPLGRPRNLRDRDQPKLREITWHIWRKIEDEVRQSLALPS